MTVEGIRDVRLRDLTESNTEAPAEFVSHLQELYDLLPDSTTEDPRAQVDAALSSNALMRIHQIIPLLPSHLRPFRSDNSSIINIAMRLALQQLSTSHMGHP
jgi:hypothetical protein